jgi:hypothetical protein
MRCGFERSAHRVLVVSGIESTAKMTSEISTHTSATSSGVTTDVPLSSPSKVPPPFRRAVDWGVRDEPVAVVNISGGQVLLGELVDLVIREVLVLLLHHHHFG